MGLHRDYDNNQAYPEYNFEEDGEDLSHQRHVRRMLEARLERKRLKEELNDELEGEFDWDEFDK